MRLEGARLKYERECGVARQVVDLWFNVLVRIVRNVVFIQSSFQLYDVLDKGEIHNLRAQKVKSVELLLKSSAACHWQVTASQAQSPRELEVSDKLLLPLLYLSYLFLTRISSNFLQNGGHMI